MELGCLQRCMLKWQEATDTSCSKGTFHLIKEKKNHHNEGDQTPELATQRCCAIRTCRCSKFVWQGLEQSDLPAELALPGLEGWTGWSPEASTNLTTLCVPLFIFTQGAGSPNFYHCTSPCGYSLVFSIFVGFTVTIMENERGRESVIICLNNIRKFC